ncbi:MAG: DEAD/DEAH box helicase family protein, partial [Intestinibacter sp.]|uniref:DEAD/DEAH box helicase family protein n=1 Tax=Intestinibacter sp. TaxID=1965304 RepID=UPI003F175708
MRSIDNLFIATDEIKNHAEYIANEIIEIDKYLGETKRGVLNIVAGAQGGETHLLIAPTGSGKSYEIINTLKNFNIKSLFILPNSANVQQAMQEYDIPGAYDNLCAINAINNGNVVVMTWDKTSKLIEADLSDHIIIIDEIHQTYTDTYRNKAIKGLYDISKRCKGRIDITATPNKLDFEIYDYITEYKQKNQTKYNVKLYNGVDTKTIIDILNKSNNGALLMNDTKELKYISCMLNKKSDVITSDTKEHSKLYDEIMFKSHMGDFKVLLNTTTIVAGVNIKNPLISDIILVGIKDIGTIKQYVARFRELEEVNVHIFNNYKEECSVYDTEWLVSENIKKANMLKDAYNIACNGNTEFSTLGLNINPINLDTNIYFNKDTNSYEVDTIYIKSQVYKKYYNSRTFESFKYLLEEYFNDIELIYNLKVCEETLIDKKVYKRDLKEAKEEALKELEKYKNILVGYDEIKKNKRSLKLMEYQNSNGLSMDHVQREYLKYGIHNLILNNSLKSMINLYSKYVLDNQFSLELAWNLANMGNRKKGNIFAKINALIYKELKEEYPNAFGNDYSIEVRVFEWLVNEINEGMSYTSEHLEILSEAFKIRFGDNWALTPKKIGEILNQIYRIDKVKNKKLTQVETLFYRNIIPTQVKNDRLNYNTIKSRIELSGIKKELAVTSSDLSLENSIKN